MKELQAQGREGDALRRGRSGRGRRADRHHPPRPQGGCRRLLRGVGARLQGAELRRPAARLPRRAGRIAERSRSPRALRDARAADLVPARHHIVSTDAPGERGSARTHSRPGCASRDGFTFDRDHRRDRGGDRPRRADRHDRQGESRPRRWLAAVEHFDAGRTCLWEHRGSPPRRPILTALSTRSRLQDIAIAATAAARDFTVPRRERRLCPAQPQTLETIARRPVRTLSREAPEAARRPRKSTDQLLPCGRLLTSRMPGCSRFTRPGEPRDSLDEEPPDWRAVCGKTDRTVRREGSAKADPYPYQTAIVERRLPGNARAVSG